MKSIQSLDADGLYPQQREAVTKMSEWFNSKSLEFTFSGSAGTGKTHTISVFLKTVGKNINYCVTAPTHKALHEIEKRLHTKGKTLHSLHGLRMNVDLLNFDIENPQFDPNGTPHIQNYRLIIIDEASMVNASLFELNRINSKTFRTKILYVGDSCQLPPPNEDVGRIFKDVVDNYELTQVIRQGKDNDLLDLFTMLREDIINKTSNCITKLIKSKDKKIANNYQVYGTKYREKVIEMFTSPEFVKNTNYIRQACFTNDAVNKWNQTIRQHVIQSDDILHLDDFLTAYTNQIDSFKMPIISNSDDYIINDIDTYIDSIEINTFAVNLKGLTDGKVSPKLLIANHSDINSFKKIENVLNHLHYQAAVKRVPEGFINYYNFKNRILLMTGIQLNDQNKRKIVKKDIDYGYALTIHKLQGSTIQNIAVDLHNIVYPTNNPNMVNDVDTRNRLLYVALSRASDNAIIHY